MILFYRFHLLKLGIVKIVILFFVLDSSTPLKTKKRLAAADALKSSSREFLDTLEVEASQAERLDITPSEKEQLDYTEDDFETPSGKLNKGPMFMSPEAQAILDSTPELVQSESSLELNINEAQKVNKQNVSLFAEMQQQEDALTVEQQSIKEFDRLLVENKELIDLR